MAVDRLRIFIGWDPEQMAAWVVAEMSARMRSQSSYRLDINRIAMAELQSNGLYWRPTRPRIDADMRTLPGYWDEVSEAPMSTGHAIARFLVPHLCDYEGWALFADGDVLFRKDPAELFALADPRFALQVVKHQYEQAPGLKMEGALQTAYARKNWSSVMLLNCGHPSNRALTPEVVNARPGRDLHGFCWLRDSEIGALPVEWNYLVGHSPLGIDPALVHFTEGIPNMPGYEYAAFADEWHTVARRCGYHFERPLRPKLRRA